jgi:hypothetical protein
VIYSVKDETLRKLDFLVLFRNLSEPRRTGRLLDELKEFLLLTHCRALPTPELLLDVLGLNSSAVLSAGKRFDLVVHYA